jgi:predicted DNA-binding transcriptional regulator AlpA
VQRSEKATGQGKLLSSAAMPTTSIRPPEIKGFPQRLISTTELAEMLGVSESWVNKSHVFGTGPRATRVGRRRLYCPADIEAWLATRKQRSTSEEL